MVDQVGVEAASTATVLYIAAPALGGVLVATIGPAQALWCACSSGVVLAPILPVALLALAAWNGASSLGWWATSRCASS